MTVRWPLDELVAALRDLHSIAANEAADRLAELDAKLDTGKAFYELTVAQRNAAWHEVEVLDAKVAAVVAALDQMERSRGIMRANLCVSAVAKAVGR